VLAPITAEEFSALMAPLGAGRRVAVAVSGGADSMALALLTAGWGEALALIVDHGVRAESAAEAALVARRLAERGITARVLTVRDLAPGPGIAARARAARYAALSDALRRAGICDLLVAHHARDQAETYLQRLRAKSGPAGLAAMAPIVETHDGRILRPLLSVAPGRLRSTLVAAGCAWVEDPTNRDTSYERVRLRNQLNDEDGDGELVRRLCAEAAGYARLRAANERAIALEMAEKVAFYAQGFAYVAAPSLSAGCLSTLVRTLGGKAYPPAPRQLARFADGLRPATVGGMRIMKGGKYGPGFLLLREAAAIPALTPATPYMLWDNRFRLDPDAQIPAGCMVVTGGGEPGLGAAIRATMPRLMLGDQEIAGRFWFTGAMPATMTGHPAS